MNEEDLLKEVVKELAEYKFADIGTIEEHANKIIKMVKENKNG
jgi:hypothetical protein